MGLSSYVTVAMNRWLPLAKLLSFKMSTTWDIFFIKLMTPIPLPKPHLISTLAQLFMNVHFPTGDPRQDMEYERQYQTQSTYIVPDVIKNFLIYFRKCVKEQNVYGIQDAYENGWVVKRYIISFLWSSLRIQQNQLSFCVSFLCLIKFLFICIYCSLQM